MNDKKSDKDKAIKPDYIIEDAKEPENHTTQNRSGFMIFILLLLLVMIPLSIIVYEKYSEAYSVEQLTGWYEGNLTFETTENDPEGYYDRYPEYLIAGKIPVVFKVEVAEKNQGRLTIIDATKRRSNMEYRIWIEDGKLLGEPIDANRDVKTRLDLFGEIGDISNGLVLAGSLGIKDMYNDAVAVFNFQADRKESDLEVEYISDKGMSHLVRRMEASESKPDLSGLWLDIAPKPGIRFAIVNAGDAYDPEGNIKIRFDQNQFILMYLEDEYEVVPFEYDGKYIVASAEYLIMENGKIFVTSDEGSYLIDETIFKGDPLIKVKLGDIDKELIVERIFIEMQGSIEIEDNRGFLYMDVEIVKASGKKNYNLMLELLDM